MRHAITAAIIAVLVITASNAYAGSIQDEAFNAYVQCYHIYTGGTDPNKVATDLIGYLNNLSKRHLAYVHQIASDRAQVSSLADSPVAPVIAHFAQLVYNSRR